MSEILDQPARIVHESDRREEGTVHVLTVSNPAKLNILNSEMMDQMRTLLKRCADDPLGRVVVIRGAGKKAWIGGADIQEMAQLDFATAVDFIRNLHSVCQAVRSCPLPVIAAIRGYCLGAGLEVAASCDLRLAAEDSSYGMPEVRVGLPSVIEAALLPMIIGVGRARELVLTGRIVDANEVWRWGLLNGLVPDLGLDALVDVRVDDIMQAAPGAVRLQKRMCNIWDERALNDSIEAGAAIFAGAFESGEPTEYMQRFLARRRK